jgi:hypothetical protein
MTAGSSVKNISFPAAHPPIKWLIGSNTALLAGINVTAIAETACRPAK